MGRSKPAGGCHSANESLRPNRAKNLESEFSKSQSHPVKRFRGEHRADEYLTVPPGQTIPSRRHVECVDCHNPHLSQPGLHEEGTNEISPVLLGSFGARPITWPPAGETVTGFDLYQFIPQEADGERLEAYICFRCHSYYSYGFNPPADERDMAVLFNTNNASYHPVAEAGKSPDLPSLLVPLSHGAIALFHPNNLG